MYLDECFDLDLDKLNLGQLDFERDLYDDINGIEEDDFCDILNEGTDFDWNAQKKIVAALLLIRQKDFPIPKAITSPLFESHKVGNGDYGTKFHFLVQDDQLFFEYFRMRQSTYYYILRRIEPSLTSKRAKDYVCPEEQLMIFIRFLASVNTFRGLSFEFCLSHITIRTVVYRVAKAVWMHLHAAHFPQLTTEKLMHLAEENERMWQFPNAWGSIDGKHIRIRQPPHSGSLFYNYKHYNSIVLQGCADAHSRFIHISVGALGKESDGGVFRRSDLGRAINSGAMQLPTVKLPFSKSHVTKLHLVGDNAYSQQVTMMTPYNRRSLTREQRIYNYRLSRLRKSIECAFGRLAAKWRYLLTPVGILPSKAVLIVQVTCLLYNI